VKIDGGDMIEVEVYKEKKEHRKKGSKERHQKELSTKKEERERRVNSVTICTNLSSLGELVEG